MKKVYMPTMDELYLMQDMGANMYKYILVKAVESLAMDGTTYTNKGILKSAYRYLRENPEIAYAICRMYPEEIKYSETAKNDISLCQELIMSEDTQDTSIYSLDNLNYFEEGLGVLSNLGVISTTARILAHKLPKTPKYRFEYKQNSLLDSIFSCEIPAEDIHYCCLPGVSKDFITIEPAYALKLNPSRLSGFAPSEGDKAYFLNRSVNAYADRYGISSTSGYEYQRKDILTNPDTEVKRLLKCINEHQKRYQ